MTPPRASRWASPRWSCRWPPTSWCSTSCPARDGTGGCSSGPPWGRRPSPRSPTGWPATRPTSPTTPATASSTTPTSLAAAGRDARRWARKVRRVTGPVAVGTGVLATTSWLSSRTNPLRMWERGQRHDRGGGPLAWAAAIVGWDFIYYWNHRMMHEVRGMWAIHVVHHSSERYNLSTALRQPVADVLGVWVPYGLLARVGIRPALISQARGINLLYQYWIHTDAIRSIGPGEEVLNTPSHHRVHHGSNQRVPRSQPRQHPHRLGPPLRHLPAGGGAGRLRPHQEHRDVQPGARSPATSTPTSSATSPTPPTGTTASRSCSAAPGWAYRRHAERAAGGGVG